MKKERICKNCKYHQHEDIDDGYVCCNPDSDYVGDWTDENDWCSEWKEKSEGLFNE